MSRWLKIFSQTRLCIRKTLNVEQTEYDGENNSQNRKWPSCEQSLIILCKVAARETQARERRGLRAEEKKRPASSLVTQGQLYHYTTIHEAFIWKLCDLLITLLFLQYNLRYYAVILLLISDWSREQIHDEATSSLPIGHDVGGQCEQWRNNLSLKINISTKRTVISSLQKIIEKKFYSSTLNWERKRRLSLRDLLLVGQ